MTPQRMMRIQIQATVNLTPKHIARAIPIGTKKAKSIHQGRDLLVLYVSL